MFSDTHFHFQKMAQQRKNGVEVLSLMAQNNCFFGLDIGTNSDDLLERQSFCEQTIAQITNHSLAEKARDFLYFSAGIWPDVDSIHDRINKMNELKNQINIANQNEDDTLHRKIIAVGECGLDHHWNPSGEDGRDINDFDKKTYEGERELFQMQIELARELNLPVIVHSRDAFEDTLDCINNMNYHNGIIHCYSYGLEEAKKFLDKGWYIILSGSVTYTKKSKLEEMNEFLKYIPNDRILCETDAPYLAPVPLRGNPNSPTFVEHTYKYVAAARNQSVEELCHIVDQNIKTLFGI